ncbi:MAG: hypothetical protein PWP23_3251 [Candidatus Sumerlaeota bacterium]|nr:hypothetical protein [Candidatus Sumerlaeota bacterium]
MPFRSGALSVRRFVVDGELPETFFRTATMAVRRYAYKPIDAERGERESFGWVNPRDVLAEKFEWEDLVDGNLVLLGVRRDRKAFNKVLYKARRDRLFADVRRERAIERLSRQNRLAIEEELTVRMLSEVTPTISFTELVWDLNTGDVFVGATSKALCERLAELFASTFDLTLVPRFPSMMGYEFMAQQGLEENFHAATAAVAGQGEGA